MILLLFYEGLKKEIELPFSQSINFWILVGLFIYFSGNFFYILLTQNSTNASNEVKSQLNILYGLITISKNLVLSFAFFSKSEMDFKSSYFPSFPKDLNLDTITPNNNTN
jgi:hypothetical protein